MDAYELMIKVNHCLIRGEILTESQKSGIVKYLLLSKSSAVHAKHFYSGVRFPDNIDSSGRRMYPVFYIPPYNDGKKLKTILNQMPKTHIFSSNMYELEVLRLLYLLAPDNKVIKKMIQETLLRLKTTCFGCQNDGMGECFDTSLVVLRFLCTVVPDETEWIRSRIDNYNVHVNEKKRPWFSLWYFWLCLSEMPFETARLEIEKYKHVMLNWLESKSCVMNSEHDKTVHPVLLYILRNILANYPEYEYIKNRKPFVNKKDGRLHFNFKK